MRKKTQAKMQPDGPSIIPTWKDGATLHRILLNEVLPEKELQRKLMGVPGTTLYDLLTFFRTLSSQEERYEAANRLFDAYFQKPIAHQRWISMCNRLTIELQQRAEERKSREITDELKRSTLTGIFLAIQSITKTDETVSSRPFYIPKWDITVYIKPLSVEDRTTLDSDTERETSGYLSGVIKFLDVKILVRTLVDEHGVRIFSDDDAALLAGKSARVLKRLFRLSSRATEQADQSHANLNSRIQHMRTALNEHVTSDLLSESKKHYSRQIFKDAVQEDLLDSSAQETFSSCELRMTLHAIIRASNISEDDLRILLMHNMDDMPFGEIARLLSLKEGSVRQRHSRALKRLQRSL